MPSKEYYLKIKKKLIIRLKYIVKNINFKETHIFNQNHIKSIKKNMIKI